MVDTQTGDKRVLPAAGTNWKVFKSSSSQKEFLASEDGQSLWCHKVFKQVPKVPTPPPTPPLSPPSDDEGLEVEDGLKSRRQLLLIVDKS